MRKKQKLAAYDYVQVKVFWSHYRWPVDFKRGLWSAQYVHRLKLTSKKRLLSAKFLQSRRTRFFCLIVLVSCAMTSLHFKLFHHTHASIQSLLSSGENENWSSIFSRLTHCTFRPSRIPMKASGEMSFLCVKRLK